MQRAVCLKLLLFVLFAGGLPAAVFADPVVWTGLTKSFSKAGYADYEMPTNQDVITSNVVLTRQDAAGIYNIAAETAYGGSSPGGTLWATDLNNPGKDISAVNWAELTFAPWVDAYGGLLQAGLNVVPDSGTPRNAVVHLLVDDIVLDLQFTHWGQRGAGGSFSYLRAEAVPEPAAASLAVFTLVSFGLLSFRRYRRLAET